MDNFNLSANIILHICFLTQHNLLLLNLINIQMILNTFYDVHKNCSPPY